MSNEIAATLQNDTLGTTSRKEGSDCGDVGSSSLRSKSGGEARFGELDDMLERHSITVLFSAPLVFCDADGKLRPFEKLDFEQEKQRLSEAVKESDREILLRFDNATYDRLLIAKAKHYGCLHYSGHGHPSGHLAFEDGKGSPHWIDAARLQRVVERKSGETFKLVFLSACHSHIAGQRFVDAGVPHVVCCRQDLEVKDVAAIAFTRQFYMCLAFGHTVKESFEESCKAVLCLPSLQNPMEEMQKFELLPEGDDHEVSIFSDARTIRTSPLTMQSVLGTTIGENIAWSSPAPPKYFTGREIDMHHVLNAVLTNPLVSVISKKDGIGRSSLVHGLCRYINDRIGTINGIDQILYVSCKQSVSFSKVLHDLLRLRWNADESINWESTSLRCAICKTFYKAQSLLVIDQTELLKDPKDRQVLIMFLSIVFCEEATEGVRVILTGEKLLGVPSIGAGVPEMPYFLGPLNFRSTVTLFSNLCCHLRTASDRRRFREQLLTGDSHGELLPDGEGAPERIRDLFVALGNGVPAEILNAAYSISPAELERLGNT